METTQSTETEVTYPTTPDTDGFFYEKEEEKESGIMTKVYENGNFVKKATLPRCGKTVIMRELIGKDGDTIRRFTGGQEGRFQMAAITVATTLDGIAQPIEAYELMKYKDFSILTIMCQALNF